MKKNIFNKKTIAIILAVFIIIAAVLTVIFLIKDGQKPESGGGKTESSDVRGSDSEKNSGGTTDPLSSDGENPTVGGIIPYETLDGNEYNPSDSDKNGEDPAAGEIIPYETLDGNEENTGNGTVKGTEAETESKTGATDGNRPTDSTEGETETSSPDPVTGSKNPLDLPMVSFGDN